MPKKVRLAIRLLYVVIGLGIIQVAMLVLRHIDVRSPEFLIITKLAIYACYFFILYQLGKGENWARWLLFAILFLAVTLAVLPAFQSFSQYPLYNLLEATQLLLYLGALKLLFHGSASGWFAGNRRPKQSDAKNG